jgi:hypothetical protein
MLDAAGKLELVDVVDRVLGLEDPTSAHDPPEGALTFMSAFEK